MSRFSMSRVKSACTRRIARWFGRRPFVLPSGPPIVSFTFDDFPRSALRMGGKILEDAGIAGTYYVSLGLMGQMTPTGEIFYQNDLPQLFSGGHELGCHTFHHHPAWTTPPGAYVSSVEENQRTLASIAPGQVLTTHSYPISYPRPATKRLLSQRFVCARGGGQTFNHGSIDLNYLNSFFLEQSHDDFTSIERVINANVGVGGWLVFSTHDVCASPTRFGCQPAFFEKVAQCALRSGASILPVAKAAARLRLPARP